MNNLWTRIGIGALAVFAVGMVAVSIVRDAHDRIEAALGSALQPPASAPAADPAQGTAAGSTEHGIAQLASLSSLASHLRGSHGAFADQEMPFRLDGHRIGTIRRLVIQRTIRNEIPAMNLAVDLSSAGEAQRLRHCDLLVADGDGSGVEDGFSCGDQGDASLVTIGYARFEPTGDTRPIAVSERASRRMRDGDPFKATVESDGQVRVNVSDNSGKRVQVNAGDGGADVRVNDELGRAILRLLADSTGASLHVRDKNGKEIVRMEAGDGGFSLQIDSAASR